jgi:hypothetical protein
MQSFKGVFSYADTRLRFDFPFAVLAELLKMNK